ncbi:MAG: DUF2332 domain-containing protein [Microbacterium sp.]|uniref:DUF2332 family protein n=1 Tax=Microbacterium sp. TaxID=51671 RepID=UPI0039E4E2D4
MDDPLAQTYDDFGRRWARGTSPLYQEWSIGIAGDHGILDLLRALPRRMQQPNLVFAAARWEGCPLGGYPEWRAWALEHWDRIVETAAARSTQTNEPNRCATLVPQFARIDGPVALLEVGAAAGLCLFPDRYGYDYAGPDGASRLDPPGGRSAVSLACRIDEPPPGRVPEVVWRRGIDLDPIDARDEAAIDWLATLIWPGPDHDARVARLRAAARVAADDPPEIVRGDLLERTADVADSAPRDAHLIVFHSAVLLYLDAEQRRRFADLVTGLGDALGRTITWLSNETAGTLPEIDAQLPEGMDASGRFVQTVDGAAVALAGQHGATYETALFR